MRKNQTDKNGRALSGPSVNAMVPFLAALVIQINMHCKSFSLFFGETFLDLMSILVQFSTFKNF